MSRIEGRLAARGVLAAIAALAAMGAAGMARADDPSPAPAEAEAPPPVARVLRNDTGAPVAAADVERALATTSLSVLLPAQSTFAAWGLEASATADARLLVNASSELVTLAVIEGDVAVAGLGKLPAGDVALLQVANGATRRASFDAARLAASLPEPLRAELEAPLLAQAQRQATRRWWGWYVPLGLNAQAPVPRDMEALRRQYLLEPAVVGVRRDAAGRLDTQRRLTAERFVAALAAGDTASAAALLDPEPFVQTGNGWTQTRAAYARRLAASPLAAGLQAATVEAVADAPGRFRVATAEAAWALVTAERDNMSFVTAVEREAPPAPAPVAALQGDTP